MNDRFRNAADYERWFRRETRAGRNPDALPRAEISAEIAIIRKALIGRTRPQRRLWDDTTLILALRHFAEHLGRVPFMRDWTNSRAWLIERGYPIAPNTIRRHLGDGAWRRALRKAGIIE